MLSPLTLRRSVTTYGIRSARSSRDIHGSSCSARSTSCTSGWMPSIAFWPARVSSSRASESSAAMRCPRPSCSAVQSAAAYPAGSSVRVVDGDLQRAREPCIGRPAGDDAAADDQADRGGHDGARGGPGAPVEQPGQREAREQRHADEQVLRRAAGGLPGVGDQPQRERARDRPAPASARTTNSGSLRCWCQTIRSADQRPSPAASGSTRTRRPARASAQRSRPGRRTACAPATGGRPCRTCRGPRCARRGAGSRPSARPRAAASRRSGRARRSPAATDRPSPRGRAARRTRVATANSSATIA